MTSPIVIFNGPFIPPTNSVEAFNTSDLTQITIRPTTDVLSFVYNVGVQPNDTTYDINIFNKAINSKVQYHINTPSYIVIDSPSDFILDELSGVIVHASLSLDTAQSISKIRNGISNDVFQISSYPLDVMEAIFVTTLTIIGITLFPSGVLPPTIVPPEPPVTVPIPVTGSTGLPTGSIVPPSPGGGGTGPSNPRNIIPPHNG